MTFGDVVARLDLKATCLGGCGIDEAKHRRGFLFFNGLHFADRRLSLRALRNFLLLVVKRQRLADPDYLNDRRYNYLYLYRDNIEAGRLAARLGRRLPAALSLNDRRRCLVEARKAGIHLATRPAIYAWARRGTYAHG